ncbi:MAG: imidazoleglycerol-phosphate dehydratase [Methanothrix sp.]|jgi:imidazoleglycerol-phosphate dehydratase|uniref:Imidazoleglycerol-phosphate dehydratase, putative n=1 Tax=Methanothrix harundinacea TaxID=301375 RepID=A0A101IKI1_9EURY|nr:MAG: imidazoleglycerol-phosphate dehydratase [Methanosaeta sp. SDB]KUK44791.1 MAG: Imidazoleglycerol-phosphate dehydratase, putative [Methanothrix harundinacea]MDD2639204.1 imidazoleglycerol-phosphate dehydratase [Methanothrix sp.]MDI9399423.1 imidazoleglycerol-phosphate dehydratase [Euryarchaeota archaeon]KUK96846.1 MAG: Imidazoleglycerol-phosphate dehydratase, putative [Methanothrix harundinacea]
MRASFRRDTSETEVEVSLDLGGSGSSAVQTRLPLLDEILKIVAQASGFDIVVEARGDLPTGDHHIVEDVAIALGSVLAKLVEVGIGSSTVPSGEALAFAAIRFGAPGYREDVKFQETYLEGVQLENIGHFMRTLAYNGRFTLHLRASGGDDWQKVEALFLSLGRALRRAVEDGERQR